jgi:hypothetical protein
MEEIIEQITPKQVNNWSNSLTFGGGDDDVTYSHIPMTGRSGKPPILCCTQLGHSIYL